MRFDHRIFCREAKTVLLSYATCFVGMVRHCHVVADPFTNMLVFFYVRFLESGQHIPRSHANRTS